MRVLTVLREGVSGPTQWVVVEQGLRVSSLVHATPEFGIEEAKAVAIAGHRRGDPRDVRIKHGEGHLLVTAPVSNQTP